MLEWPSPAGWQILPATPAQVLERQDGQECTLVPATSCALPARNRWEVPAQLQEGRQTAPALPKRDDWTLSELQEAPCHKASQALPERHGRQVPELQAEVTSEVTEARGGIAASRHPRNDKQGPGSGSRPLFAASSFDCLTSRSSQSDVMLHVSCLDFFAFQASNVECRQTNLLSSALQ